MRRLLLAGLAALAVLAGVDTGLWWFATGRLEAEFAAWQAQCRALGWAVSAAPPARAGWPLAAAIAVPELALAGGEADFPGGLAWRTDHAELSVALLQPRLLHVLLSGQQRLRLSDRPEFGLTADRFEVIVPLVPGSAAHSLTLAAQGVRADLPAGPLSIATLASEADLHPAAARGADAAAMTASAEAIGLPPMPNGRPWPLGPRIASVSFEAAVTGPLAAAPDFTIRAKAWRDAGGTLVVRRLALGWGSLGVSGNATITLDEHLQPIGTATARLVGYEAGLDALASNGAIPQNVAQAVKGVLTILARRPEGGGSPQVELPLSLQDRTLAAGRFPLIRLPQFIWP